MSLNYGNEYTCSCGIAKLPMLGIGKGQTQSILSLKGLKLPDRAGYNIPPVCRVFQTSVKVLSSLLGMLPKTTFKAPVFIFH